MPNARTNGVITIKSEFGQATTLARLVGALGERGLTIFSRVDHAAGAAKVGLEMLPSELVLFGNSRMGAPLMQMTPELALDLPLKALVWGDKTGATRLSYNDPTWLASRHGLSDPGNAYIQAIATNLTAVAQAATARRVPKHP
jgi:uncharacterized protein (DUF302 family)